MNYPVWDLQSSGLIIAIIAVLHVFVSHFAVGGGLFLVVAEHKARRENDAALLGFVRRHSRFFILLTLVFGAITGVGIWFAITLVHPAATASLITTFVWGWAIEWTFFLAEVAAAMVYYYGWDRLSPRDHLITGWIYFVNAFLSLVVINGILSYMLTPGEWLRTRRFWDGFFNPTYWPSLAARTFGCAGLAGLYALFTAASLQDRRLKAKIVRYAGLGWVLPMAVALPLSMAWFLSAAGGAGVPLGEIFGVKEGAGFLSIVATALSGPAATGQPFAQRAVGVSIVAMAAALILTLAVVLLRGERYGRPMAAALLACGLFAIGGAEWVREGMRKPYVIGGYMFVNGIRLEAPPGAPRPPAGPAEDPLAVPALAKSGVLAATPWVRIPEGYAPGRGPAEGTDPARAVELEAAAGKEIFRLECAACHSIDRYNAIRPLVAGKSSATLAGTIARLAEPEEGGEGSAAGSRFKTWRGRRMPPFVGTPDEARSLSVFLAKLGGGEIAPPPAPAAGPAGAALFEANCSACHSPDSEWPMAPRLKGRSAAEFYEMLGRLAEVNENMPPFEGTDEERQALADYLAGLAAAPGGK